MVGSQAPTNGAQRTSPPPTAPSRSQNNNSSGLRQQRPPHQPFGSAKSTLSGNGSSASGCRLLWRGKLVCDDGTPIHGIAIVAHLFSVPSLSPQQISSQLSPFDDPFSASPSSSGADMCLGLEMLRSADIRVSSEVEVVRPGLGSRGHVPIATMKERVEVETPTGVRVYVDQRCSETVDWFEAKFCEGGREGVGIRLNAGGEDVILFGSYPDRQHVDVDGADGRPAMTLLLGRPRQARAARPDDPMPRENLFASKLRRTNSLPVLAFGAPPPRPGLARSSTLGLTDPSHPKARPKPRESKVFLSLLSKGKSDADVKGKGKEKERSLPPPSLPPRIPRSKSETSLGKKKSLSRTSSSQSLGGASASTSALAALSLKRRIAPGAGTPGRRGAKRPKPIIKELSSSEDEGDDDLRSIRMGSPTPSVATLGGGEDEDALRDLKPRGNSLKRVGGGLKRSTSAPVGLFSIGSGSGSAPSSKTVEGIEVKNKTTTSKLILARLSANGIDKNHSEFKELFSIIRRGVQFALRKTFTEVLVDRIQATELIDRHIVMYLPTSPSIPTPPLVIKLEEVKEEEEEDTISPVKVDKVLAGRSHMPSPESLEPGEEDMIPVRAQSAVV